MVEYKNIRDMNHVKELLEYIKEYVIAYEEQIGELSENASENITFQLAEIDAFIIGNQKYIAANIAMAHIRLDMYWEYIDGECSFEELLKGLKEYEGEI